MATLTENYNGFDVSYSEFSNDWSCRELSFRAPSLKEAKAKIDKHNAALRKLNKLPVFLYLVKYGNDTLETCHATSITEDGRIWVQRLKKHDHGNGRQMQDPHDFILDTPEHRAIAAEAKKFYTEAAELKAKGKALLDGMPKLTLADFKRIAGERLDDENVA